ncbi:MAG: hypothetical protein A3G32_00840 [Deltaproteobacteria bacterium RIFCSPLOWO2_12_FULL_40_28]|nr:MAG: hypothetical protein A3C45_09725 [Deltaproteobacteria bacterium RIFCSPHIGHO2_02_FULL_40_28]OGQ19886.1 MAG: hypothetical protein A3E27_06675 [Deltaproteobacteria bacterium RIFCSPHIGHO2_12_FULL_40_32]OGQ39645.1 MAG: hypothetical protein A3I69_06105 [Deltaproteobacteria bacterium RIFCSPLOWO2_02_FULL_40_36]OGQ52901.1 MAG: hypothetical protein A3G32_00840 [Deltaproteobacteria bacterium RIFCSPLOWO2_12_FULL_40_28]
MPFVEIHSISPGFLILALVFVLLNAFFVAAEFALVKTRSTHLEVLANQGHPMATLAKHMVSNLDSYLSATQLGITLASLGLGWIGEPAFAKLLEFPIHYLQINLSDAALHSVSLSLAFLVISALHIILGELVPKTLAIQYAEKICFIVAIPLQIFYILFFPFLWILNESSFLFLKMFGFKRYRASRAHSEEEIKLILEDSVEQGKMAPQKQHLLDNALDFSHRKVADIMVPVAEIACFYLDKTVEENLEYAKESGHTRFPLKESQKGRFIGFVHIKDVIWSLENKEMINLFDLKRSLLFLNENLTIDRVLKEFQRGHVHMAAVSHSTSLENKIIGFLTLEDVIEELVGEINDEFDLQNPNPQD